MNIYLQRFKTAEQRFWEKVDKSGGKDACWVWKGLKDKNGYGVSSLGKERRASRICWIISFGEIPEGMQVLHHCDNPPCVNPKHLWLGTGADNMQDKTRKGRNNAPVGERSGSVKLKTSDVLEIRRLHKIGVVQRRIAERFNIGFKAINKIVLRQRWCHV